MAYEGPASVTGRFVVYARVPGLVDAGPIDLTSRTSWWLDLAIVIYAAVYLYSFFVQRRIVERIIELTSSPPPPEGPPPELPALAVRAQRGGMAMLVLLVAVVFLMVVKPQL